MTGAPSLTVWVEKSPSLLPGVHELVGDADGVVGVLEEDGGVGLGVGAGAVVAGSDERVGLGFFLGFALDEVDDVGMVDVEDDHLGGAAGFAAGLDDAGEGVEAAHEAQRAAGGAAAGEQFGRAADGREIGAGAASPLEEHAFGLGEGEDGVERIFDGVDEAGGALRVAIAGGGEDDFARFGIPVPVLRIGVGLEAIAADVEPDGRVEGDLLLDKEVGEVVAKGVGIFLGGEVAALLAPVGDGLGHAADEGADAALALGRADLAVEIFGGDDVGRGHGPVDGDLDILLLEDDFAAHVIDGGGAALPLDFVVGRDAGFGELAREAKAGSWCGFGRSGGGGGLCCCGLSGLGHGAS